MGSAKSLPQSQNSISPQAWRIGLIEVKMGKGEGISEHYGSGSSPRYVQMQNEPTPSTSDLHRHKGERIFEESPRATIVEVSRAELNDLSHIQLIYTIEIEYKQVRISCFFFECAFNIILWILHFLLPKVRHNMEAFVVLFS